MAELVDAPVLGTGFARSEGSSPFIRILITESSNNNSRGYSLRMGYLLVAFNRLFVWFCIHIWS
jgi:hypothetical protein